jgi:hypothetical protein
MTTDMTVLKILILRRNFEVDSHSTDRNCRIVIFANFRVTFNIIREYFLCNNKCTWGYCSI